MATASRQYFSPMATAPSGDDTGGSAARHVQAFINSGETTPDLLRETMWRIVDIVREILRSQRRASVWIVAFAFVFELLSRSLVTEASMAGIKLSRIEFLTTLIPVAISYSYLRFAALARDLGSYSTVLYHLTDGKFAGLRKSELDRMVIYIGGPTTAPLPTAYAPHFRRLAAVASLAELVLYNLVPLVFNVYAFWRLFATRGPGDALVWISLTASALLVVFAFSFVAMGIRALDDPHSKLGFDEWLSAFRPLKDVDPGAGKS
jgi:hypothetical protein